MKNRIADIYRSLTPDALVALWLAVWWLMNIIEAGCTELANDEAYYHLFALQPAWGYFDHPPVTAILVWLGERLFGGELGVRFFFTALQPAYLYIFWRTIRPADASRCDAVLYTMICAAMLVLQLYGFIAVPDGPLMFFTALFLLTFKRFTEERRAAWLPLGLTLGLLALSKYHGALVLLFALAANAGAFVRRPRLILHMALSGIVALAVITPHLLWQYHHDWASFAYHLSGRNGYFEVSNITDFLANMLVVFSPFYVPLWVQAYRKVKPATPVERTLWLYPAAFIGFFLMTSLRGYVQPQWAIVAVFGLIWLLFSYARVHARTRRYVMRAGWVTLALIALVRVEMIFNPIGLKFEVFDNHTSYGQIAEIAAGRPVIFDSKYAVAAKYMYYTGGEAFSQPNVSHRTSQWQYRDDDRSFTGRDVLVEVDPAKYREAGAAGRLHTIHMANGNDFNYVEVSDFHPTRGVDIEAEGLNLPATVHGGEVLRFTLHIRNPYPYDIDVDGKSYLLQMLWGWRKQQYLFFPLTQGFTIPAKGTCDVECSFTVPRNLQEQPYAVGFAVRGADMYTWFNGKSLQTHFEAE